MRSCKIFAAFLFIIVLCTACEMQGTKKDSAQIAQPSSVKAVPSTDYSLLNGEQRSGVKKLFLCIMIFTYAQKKTNRNLHGMNLLYSKAVLMPLRAC